MGVGHFLINCAECAARITEYGDRLQAIHRPSFLQVWRKCHSMVLCDRLRMQPRHVSGADRRGSAGCGGNGACRLRPVWLVPSAEDGRDLGAPQHAARSVDCRVLALFVVEIPLLDAVIERTNKPRRPAPTAATFLQFDRIE